MPDYDAGLQAANAMKNGIGLKITLKEIFREKLKDLDRIWPKISCLVESFSQLSSQLTWTKTELSADFGAKTEHASVAISTCEFDMVGIMKSYAAHSS
mmetsp:Transcript_38196/g.80021  ORF Transcript_38196/g.80021 Transcript_38196/m.80021 type:complete len:98 (-) Transcript_38196:418-711(-)